MDFPCVPFSSTRLGQVSVIIYSDKFSIPCSLSSSYNHIMRMLLRFRLQIVPKVLSTILIFKVFFFFLALIGCFFLRCLPNCWFDPLLHPTYCLFLSVFFIWDILFFISDWSFIMVSLFSFVLLSILVAITLNFISDKFLTSISFSFFWRFLLFFHLGPIYFSPHLWLSLYIKYI